MKSTREQEINKLADAFYNEDYDFIKKVTGKRPTNKQDAEQLINIYLQKGEK